uniref:Uncharacterized protein n=1 Tax=Haptolina brevifila TaxID=156173 RepID=A0A7S2HCX8_9EUKA
MRSTSTSNRLGKYVLVAHTSSERRGPLVCIMGSSFRQRHAVSRKNSSIDKAVALQGAEAAAAAEISAKIGDTAEKAKFVEELETTPSADTISPTMKRQASSIKAMEQQGVAYAPDASVQVHPVLDTGSCCAVQ